MTFEELQLHPTIQDAIRAKGYKEPTPIQTAAIPPILAGKDVLGLAKTGTGKTAAFALPILHRLTNGAMRRPRVLVLTPTRELCEQVAEGFLDFVGNTKVRVNTVYGGVGQRPQLDRFHQGYEVVVACPGRLLDHLQQGNFDTRGIEVLVLDEADQMFDIGFLPGIRRIISYLPKQRQNLLFSATMPPPLRLLADEILRNPVRLELNNNQPAETISHAIYPVTQGRKIALLLAMLKEFKTDSVLVFTRTKHRAERVGRELKHAGYHCATLQGNLSQQQRKRAMDGFRSGHHNILVATDIAARGIDVATITHVINLDIPETVEAYTHRIGRTGRAERTGDACTYVTPEDADMVRQIERTLGKRLERKELPGFDIGDMNAPDASPPPRGQNQPHNRQQQRPGGKPPRPPARGPTAGPTQAHSPGARPLSQGFREGHRDAGPRGVRRGPPPGSRR